MANSVKLMNGSTVQVRTGVIQGIGPIGPRGPAGETGPPGDQGQTGLTGPPGQIVAQMTRGDVTTSNPIAANTDTVISFNTRMQDDLRSFQSNTAMLLRDPGDYMFSCWLRFDDAAAGLRDLWFLVGSTIMARASRTSATGSPFYANLSHPYRSLAGNETVTVLARASAATAIAVGSVTINRIGSGPQGVPGPPGVQGEIGATGGQGPKGDPGSASTGFSTYALLLPH